MTDWQPIETAPKDGTNIIVSNGQAVAQGWWCDEPGYIREHRDLDGHYIDQDESDGFTGWMDCDGGMQPDATHWQPLPPPPGVTEAPASMREALAFFVNAWDGGEVEWFKNCYEAVDKARAALGVTVAPHQTFSHQTPMPSDKDEPR